MKFLPDLPGSIATVHWIHRWNRIIGLGQFVVCTLYILVSWHRIPPAVPLWYSKPWGIDRLVPPYMLLLLPITTIIIYGINTYISNKIYALHPIYARVLLLTTMLISIISTGVIVGIIRVIT